MSKSTGLSFRSAAHKVTKPSHLRNSAGFYTYVCHACGNQAHYRKRQIHADKTRCLSCRGVEDA